MAISKTKNYLVLNYNPSPVAISTKHESYLVEGGTKNSPGTLPLTFDEISVVNSNSLAFKIGLLRFEPEYEQEFYEALSVPNWQDIFTIEQIEDALLHPTIETSQRILAIENDAYFERIRGVMIGLKNSGVDISGKIERMIEERRRELARRQRKTNITLVAKPEESASSEVDELKAQLAQMQEMMAQMMAQMPQKSNDSPVEDKPKQTKPRTAPKNKEKSE